MFFDIIFDIFIAFISVIAFYIILRIFFFETFYDDDDIY